MPQPQTVHPGMVQGMARPFAPPPWAVRPVALPPFTGMPAFAGPLFPPAEEESKIPLELAEQKLAAISQDYEELLGVCAAQHADELREKDEALQRLQTSVQDLAREVEAGADGLTAALLAARDREIE